MKKWVVKEKKFVDLCYEEMNKIGKRWSEDAKLEAHYWFDNVSDEQSIDQLRRIAKDFAYNW